MATKVKAVSLYIDNTKIGEMREVTMTFKTNGERIHTLDETIKTQGAVDTDVSFETIVPEVGLKLDMFALTVNQPYTTLMIPANGKNYTCEGTFDEATLKSIVQTGATTGSFKWSGGKPSVAS
jgi:hypothetical protein